MSEIERGIFGCPSIDEQTIEKEYPGPSDDDLLLMSLGENVNYPFFQQVYGKVKWNAKGEDYIEIIFYNEQFCEGKYRRFIIQKGYCMTELDELEFLDYIRNEYLEIDYSNFVYLQEDISEYMPDAHLRVYNPEEIGRYLERVYYSSFRNGAREILFKAGLEQVAFLIDSIDSYNLIGSTPESILDLPINLIRLFEREAMFEYLCNPVLREKAKEIYVGFSDYFGKNGPNRFQWMYLEEFKDISDGKFSKKYYRYLNGCIYEAQFDLFKEFIRLSEVLGDRNPYRKIPKIKDIDVAVSNMKLIKTYLVDNCDYDTKIALYNGPCGYEFEDETYKVIVPMTVKEFVDEAIQQDNCVASFIAAVASGRTHIVFIRKKEAVLKSYITVEILNNQIEQAKCRFNVIPSRKDFEFIEYWARQRCIGYKPENLIYGDDDFDFDEDDELVQYLEDFHKRNSFPTFEDVGPSGVQLTLQDLFPGCFTVVD